MEQREPSEVVVVVYSAEGVHSHNNRPVKVVIKLGSQKFATDELAPPKPQWMTEARLEVKHGASDTLVLRLKDAMNVDMGQVKLQIGGLPTKLPAKQWVAFETPDHSQSPGHLCYAAYVSGFRLTHTASSALKMPKFFKRAFSPSPLTGKHHDPDRDPDAPVSDDSDVSFRVIPPPSSGRTAGADSDAAAVSARQTPPKTSATCAAGGGRTAPGSPRRTSESDSGKVGAARGPPESALDVRPGRRASHWDSQSTASAPGSLGRQNAASTGTLDKMGRLPGAAPVDELQMRDHRARSSSSENLAPRKALCAPVIVSIEPSLSQACGGTHIVIRGRNFGNAPEDIVHLTLGGVCHLGNFTWLSDSLLTAITRPGAAAHGVNLIETRDGGCSNLEPSAFTYMVAPGGRRCAGMDAGRGGNSLQPEVSGISPLCGPAAGFTNVRIRGDNLGENREDLVAVYVAGVDCTDTVQVVSAHLIRCTTHAGRGCGAIVVITKTGGVGYSLVRFVFDRSLRMLSDSDVPSATVPAVAEGTACIDQWSGTKLRLEVARLQHRNEDLSTENLDLKHYIDRLLCKLLDIDPSGEILLDINKAYAH